MLARSACRGNSWTSTGLAPVDAFRHWHSWACETLASLEIEIPSESDFSARWESHAVGPLQMVALAASAQRLVHSCGKYSYDPGSTFQLVYSCDGAVSARIATERCVVNPGEFVLIDNAQPFEMRMGPHEAVVMLMPGWWVERWLADPFQALGRPYSATRNWGRPLGSMLATMASDIEHAVLPRTAIADQLGSLLALAVGHQPVPASRHRAKLTQRLIRMIETRHADPALDPAEVARLLGISKRYVHALLAETGTTFVATLNRARLARARELLSDPRLDRLQVAEISWQCGYLDPSYFARLFRRSFGACPREWRAQQRAQG